MFTKKICAYFIFFSILVVGLLLLNLLAEENTTDRLPVKRRILKTERSIKTNILSRQALPLPPKREPIQKANSPPQHTEFSDNHLKTFEFDRNEDIQQKLLEDEIADEINYARSIWRKLRDQIYNQMQLDPRLYYTLTLARQYNYNRIAELTNELQFASEYAKPELFDIYNQTNEQFNQYVKQTLGPLRFEILKNAQSNLNEQLKYKSHHGIQVSEDW